MGWGLHVFFVSIISIDTYYCVCTQETWGVIMHTTFFLLGLIESSFSPTFHCQPIMPFPPHKRSLSILWCSVAAHLGRCNNNNWGSPASQCVDLGKPHKLDSLRQSFRCSPLPLEIQCGGFSNFPKSHQIQSDRFKN